MADRSAMHPWPENDGETLATTTSTDRGGPHYGDLLAAERLLLDRLASAVLPDEVATDVIDRLTALTELVSRHQVPEALRVDGWRPDLPGRGNALIPPYVIDVDELGTLTGRVTFTRFHLGGNGAAHGGTQPLLFDDVMGRVMNRGLPGVARTAFLKVDYRAITPLDVELRFEATCDTVDGRKRWGSGRLLDPAGTVLCDVECLFLQLLPGQS